MNAKNTDLQPTLGYEDISELQTRTAEGSQPPVGIVSGPAPRFSDETAALLRTRLRAASLILAIALGTAFVRNLFLPEQFLFLLRTAVLLVMISAYIILRSRIALSLPQLRLIELVVFGGLIVQIGLDGMVGAERVCGSR